MAEYLDKDGLAYFWKKAKSYISGTYIFELKNRLQRLESSVAGKADSSDVNKIVTYKTKMNIPSSETTFTIDNTGTVIANDGTSFTESIPDGYYIVPLHISYRYFASKSDYNSNTEKEMHGLTGISAPITIKNKKLYNIMLKSAVGTWTEWTGYFEVECLLVLKPSPLAPIA